MSGPVHAGREGDDTRIDVRFVVAPAAGTFRAAPAADVTTEGELVALDAVLGHIDAPGTTVPVRSFCAGFLVRLLVGSGERVRVGTPVAWLHPVDRPATRPGDAA